MLDAGRKPAITEGDHEDVPVLDHDRVSEIGDGAEWAAHGVQAMRVAMLAPPWIPVPPPGYGGIEQVIALLAAELTERGQRGDAVRGARDALERRGAVAARGRPSRRDRDVALRGRPRGVARSRASTRRERALRRRARPLRLHGVRVRGPARHADACTRCTGRSPTRRRPSTRATRTRRARWRSAATRPSRRPGARGRRR